MWKCGNAYYKTKFDSCQVNEQSCETGEYTNNHWKRLIFGKKRGLIYYLWTWNWHLKKKHNFCRYAQSRDKRTCDRIKAVIHASDGWNAQDIAVALLIDQTTVPQHIHHYVQSKKLQPENGDSKSQLSPA